MTANVPPGVFVFVEGAIIIGLYTGFISLIIIVKINDLGTSDILY